MKAVYFSLILGRLLFLPGHAWAQELLPLSATDQQPITLVNPEGIVPVVSPPAEVPQPPLQVRLPEVVVERDQWRGVQCGVTQQRFAVFHHSDKWKSFWDKGMAPYSPKLKVIPGIDFTKEMVVGVFMGEMPSPYYEIEIRSVKKETRADQGLVLVVRYREIHKMIAVFTPPFNVQPFHLKRVALFSGQVLFEKVKR